MRSAARRARPIAAGRSRRWLALLAVPALAALGVVAAGQYGAGHYSAGSSPATRLDAAAAPADASGLPAHVLMGYWQDFTNGATPLTLADVPTSYNLVAVAFGNAGGTPGQVTFSLDSGLSSALGGYTDSQFTSDIQTLHARGQKVILSVGGQNGAISVTDAASAGEFASSVEQIIQQYGFDGVDIDLENGVNPTYMAQALEQLQGDVGSSLIITLAPQTIDTQSTASDYLALALDIKPILTMINTQYYNSGTMNGCDGNVYAEGSVDFVTALACTELQSGLSASQVGIGLPASSAAAGSGYVDPSVVNNALDCLAAQANCGSFTPSASYPDIRGAMTWSINWDASNGYNFANTVAPHLAALP
jgi:chitinase